MNTPTCIAKRLLREAFVLLFLFGTWTAGAAHVHVQIGHVRGEWALHIFDLDSGRYGVDQIAIPVPLSARASIPDSPQYTTFLGAAGAPVWILPQHEREDILNLGIGTSGIASGTFTNNLIHLSLHHVHGPGHFAAFSSDAFGAPIVHMASLNGVNPAEDVIAVPGVAGHIHLNWAFTAPGVYRIGFAASGILRNSGERLKSAVVDYTFTVAGPPAPEFLSALLAEEGSAALILRSEAGAVCRIEASTDLHMWTDLVTVTNAMGRIELRVPTASHATNQFFRAVRH